MMSGPILERSELYQRFYINGELLKDGMGAVLLKVKESVKAIKSEAQEKYSGKCEFENSLERTFLRPIYFI